MDGGPCGPYGLVSPMSRFHKSTAAALLLLAVAGLTVPAAAALGAEPPCHGAEAEARADADAGPCQWIASTSCCDQPVATPTPPSVVPPPPAASSAPAFSPVLHRGLQASGALRPAGPPLGIATTVLRL